jgi:PIN domain nuclease of toxin-antitoxin system
MRLLLDTHVFYWSFYERRRLSRNTLKLIDQAEEIFVSAASIWEISIKVRLGKIKADPTELLGSIEPSGFQELPVFSRHALVVASLPLYHTDPFDRLLVAQAVSEPLHLVTVDAQLKQYSELVIEV